MSEQAKDRHGVLIAVLDVIREEIVKHEKKHETKNTCPVCEEVTKKIRYAMLEQNEYIIEDYRLQLGV